jgi:hypothetical protein
MKKPPLSIRIDERPEDRSLEPNVLEDKGNNLERFENTKLHSRFNPCRIGFGILGVTKDVGRPTTGEEEDSPCSRRDHE